MTKLVNLKNKAQTTIQNVGMRAYLALANRKGISHFTEILIAMVVAVLVGAIVLASSTGLMEGIYTAITNKINTAFQINIPTIS